MLFRSSKLIEVLEQSTILQNAASKGTVTRGSTPGAERFVIAAESRPRPLPPQRPLLEIAEALPVAPPPAPAAAAPPATATVTPADQAPRAPQNPRELPADRAPARPGVR